MKKYQHVPTEMEGKKIKNDIEVGKQEKKLNNEYFGNNVERVTGWEGFKDTLKEQAKFIIPVVLVLAAVILILIVATT